MTRAETPRTLIARLDPSFQAGYNNIPLTAIALTRMDELLSNKNLGKSVDEEGSINDWDYRLERVAFQKGKDPEDSYASITFSRTIPIVGEDGLGLKLSSRFSYHGQRIEIGENATIRTGRRKKKRKTVFRYRPLSPLSLDLEAKAVLHLPNRQIDWTKDPANIELYTRINRTKKSPTLSVTSGYKRNRPGSLPPRLGGLLLSQVSLRSHPKNHLNHQRFQDLYDLASADSRTLTEVKLFLDQSYTARA